MYDFWTFYAVSAQTYSAFLSTYDDSQLFIAFQQRPCQILINSDLI